MSNQTMSPVLNRFQYLTYEIWEENGDPRVSYFPFMHGGPWKVCLIVGVYLYFVTSLGPKLMKNREPFDLRVFMLLYNSFLIGLNGCGFLIALWITRFATRAFNCTRMDTSTQDYELNIMTYFGWLYFASKIADFMDTVFFVLRKKNNQITGLHLFHHSAMPIISYFGLKFHPGPLSSFMPTANSFIHAIMYSYYALSAAGPEMKKYLWWKKYITQLQMLQFVLTFIHSAYILSVPTCPWPRWLAYCEAIHALLFFYMFYSFYQKAYASQVKPKVS